MRKIIASAFVSLDGVMQAPGGPDEDPTGGFRFGGWTVNYWDDAMGAVMDELFNKPFDLLLGRKTYDIFAAYWPYAKGDPIGEAFDKATKYVATRTPDRRLDWQNSETLGQGRRRGVARSEEFGGTRPSGPGLQRPDADLAAARPDRRDPRADLPAAARQGQEAVRRRRAADRPAGDGFAGLVDRGGDGDL